MVETEKKVSEKAKRDRIIGTIAIILAAVIIVFSFYIPSLLANDMESEIKAIVGNRNVGEVLLNGLPGEEPDFLSAAIKVKDVYDVEHAYRKFALYAAQIAEKAEKYPNFNEIRIVGYLESYDAKGNDGYSKFAMFTTTKDQRQGVNWGNFKDMVNADYTAIQTIGTLDK